MKIVIKNKQIVIRHMFDYQIAVRKSDRHVKVPKPYKYWGCGVVARWLNWLERPVHTREVESSSLFLRSPKTPKIRDSYFEISK